MPLLVYLEIYCDFTFSTSQRHHRSNTLIIIIELNFPTIIIMHDTYIINLAFCLNFRIEDIISQLNLT